MLELRITVLRDKPASPILQKYAANGYNLFRDTQTGLYFLTDGTTNDFDRDVFWSDYHRVLDIPFKFDWSYLEDFKAQNKDLLKYANIHDEILIDALALSDVFATRVFCVYSNDEDCDFAVTAENGKLLRLRFKAGRKQGKRIDDEIARQINTEIHAARILMDGEEPGDDEVFEYTAYEAIQTQEKPIALYPYWEYREGEIGGQVIFDTLSSKPDGTTPNLFFRNAFLEFEEAFGKAAPDFTDMPETGRFERVDFQGPPQLSFFAKAANFVKSLWARITSSRKSMLWTAGILFVLCAAIFGGEDEPRKTTKTFANHCAEAGGTTSGEFDEICTAGDRSYRDWNLPGEKGERRVVILRVGPEKVPCEGVAAQDCLIVDGDIFYGRIDGFIFSPGKKVVVPVERLQICDPKVPDDCPQDGGIFRYKQLMDLGK